MLKKLNKRLSLSWGAPPGSCITVYYDEYTLKWGRYLGQVPTPFSDAISWSSSLQRLLYKITERFDR